MADNLILLSFMLLAKIFGIISALVVASRTESEFASAGTIRRCDVCHIVHSFVLAANTGDGHPYSCSRCTLEQLTVTLKKFRNHAMV